MDNKDSNITCLFCAVWKLFTIRQWSGCQIHACLSLEEVCSSLDFSPNFSSSFPMCDNMQIECIQAAVAATLLIGIIIPLVAF